MVDESTAGARTGLEAPCAHHWLIENPSGETSRGVCRHCGAVRDFYNYANKAQNQYRSPKKTVTTANP